MLITSVQSIYCGCSMIADRPRTEIKFNTTSIDVHQLRHAWIKCQFGHSYHWWHPFTPWTRQRFCPPCDQVWYCVCNLIIQEITTVNGALGEHVEAYDTKMNAFDSKGWGCQHWYMTWHTRTLSLSIYLHGIYAQQGTKHDTQASRTSPTPTLRS